MSVGVSNRTIGKHSLLNKILGREVGIIALAKARPSFLYPEYTIIDLCAGNGEISYYSQHSSPEIITKHIKHLERHGISYNVLFCEKDKLTFEKLSKNYPKFAKNIDSAKIKEFPFKVHQRSGVFINCDPNNITDWCITKELLENSTQFTTVFITMGCNVSGLKRLPLAQRKEWFNKLNFVTKQMPSWFDATLVKLCGDRAQWAYLIIGPKKWHSSLYAKDIKTAFKYWDKGYKTAIFSNKEKFYNLLNMLFLTKKEIE